MTLSSIFERLVLRNPVPTLALALLVVLVFGWFCKDFELDVSSETLVLENDEELRYYQSILARYGSDDFLVVTYTPRGDLFAPDSLRTLAELRDELLALEGVDSVVSVLEANLQTVLDESKSCNVINDIEKEECDAARFVSSMPSEDTDPYANLGLVLIRKWESWGDFPLPVLTRRIRR